MDILNSKIVFGGTISGTGVEEHGETVIGNEGAQILGCGVKGSYENTYNTPTSTATAPSGENSPSDHQAGTKTTTSRLTRPAGMSDAEWKFYQQYAKLHLVLLI